MSSDKNQAIERKIRRKGDFEIVFGASPECDQTFPDLAELISPRHAVLKRVEDRLFLKDLRSRQGTFVNGHKIGSRAWHEITLNDDVRLGKIPMEIKPRLLLGRDRVGLYAENLRYAIPNRKERRLFPPLKVLTENVSLRAKAGSFIGVMGPSGAGKTVLLNLLSGYLVPDEGRVMIGSFNVHKSFGLIKDIIGDVPQDDTLIPELTVRQSLHYCLRLNYPDMRADVRENQIRSVLERMGFPEERLDGFLKTPIGSPEKRGLSGGERRRANIAHELVRNPLLLFLDEPTSGLSSVDSEHVVGLLKEMCRDRKVTMLMTIHQPSEAVFYLLDELLLLNRGGKVAYFGPVDEVFSYFNRYSSEPTGGNPAEYVLRVLDKWEVPRPPEEIYQEEAARRAETEPAEEDPAEMETASTGRSQKKRGHRLHQFGLLLQRNLRIKLADKMSLALLLLQVLIISLLLVATFRGYSGDYTGMDRLARTWFHFTGLYDEAVAERQTFIIEPAFERSLERADQEEKADLIAENAAQRRVSILFLMIASAVWFGVVNGSREIVSEKYILKRETRSALHIFPYLCSKLAVLILIAILQTGILLAIICSFLIIVPPKTFMQFWGVLIITSAAASALSLMISAMVRTEQASLILVPIIIIPQLFLGGLIRPVKYLTGDITRFFTDFILQKWAFKAMLSYDAMNGGKVLLQVTDLANRDPFSYVRFDQQSIAEVFFGRSSTFFSAFPGDAHALLMILLHGFIPFLLAYIWLKRKYA